MRKKLIKLFLWRFDSSPCSSYVIPCIATEESRERERDTHTHTHTHTQIERGESKGNTENWAMADALVHSQKVTKRTQRFLWTHCHFALFFGFHFNG
jgi:hypothetical protein